MPDTNSESETVLPADASALVATAAGGLEFVMANGSGDAEVQPNVQLLFAIMLQSKGPEWVGEMMTWLEGRRRVRSCSVGWYILMRASPGQPCRFGQPVCASLGQMPQSACRDRAAWPEEGRRRDRRQRTLFRTSTSLLMPPALPPN